MFHAWSLLMILSVLCLSGLGYDNTGDIPIFPGINYHYLVSNLSRINKLNVKASCCFVS